MHRMKLVGVILAGILINGGCAGRVINYSLAESEIKKPRRPMPMRVVVATFKDSRSEEEKTGGGKAEGLIRTHDRFFQRVPDGITNAVVEHLQKTGIFTQVRPATFGSAEVTRDRMEATRNDADVILVGSIVHFYGIVHRSSGMTGAMAGAAGAAGGLIGGLIFVGIESALSKDVEGHAALIDVELLSTTDGSSIWKGQAESYFKRNQKGLPEAPDLALEALKEAVKKLVDQLHEFAGGRLPEPELTEPADVVVSSEVSEETL